MARSDVAALRATLAGMTGSVVYRQRSVFPLGARRMDAALGGGLACGALHEIFAREGMNEAASASGFALGLALRAGSTRPIIWIRQDCLDAETGRLDGAGLAAFGADPSALVLVRVRSQADALKAAEEALRRPAAGALLIELWGGSRVLDLTATRRLSLAAGKSGVTPVLVRLGAEPAPSAAVSRWSAVAAPSIALEAGAPGRPAFRAELLRHRDGAPPRAWHVEWDSDRASFSDAAPIPRRLAAPAARRTPAPRARLRLAG